MTIASATDVAAAVRSGEIPAATVVSAAFDRIGADPLNAFTELDRDGALERAAAIDRIVALGGDPGPLAGVPVGVKDLIDQAGHVTTAGSAFYRRGATSTAPCIERLERVGAVVIGRTGLHEFAFGFSSENEHFGSVRNAWNPETSPGGSSGGSATAVAAGWTPLAIGTDTGGSIRVPAALCNVFGLKVTHGSVPTTGVFPLAPSADTVGPLALTVNDLGAAHAAMAGLDRRDPWTRSASQLLPGFTRVGIPTDWIESAPLSTAVADAFTEAIDTMAHLGFEIIQIDEPDLVPSPMIDDLAYGEVAPIHRAWWETHPGRYGAEVAERLAQVFDVTLDRHVAAHRWRAALRGLTSRTFRAVDVIVTPATCVTVKRIGVDTVPTRSGEVGYRRALAWFTALVNHMGCPAIVGPLAGHESPAPALQIVAPWWGEERLLACAEHLEARDVLARPGPAPPSW